GARGAHALALRGRHGVDRADGAPAGVPHAGPGHPGGPRRGRGPRGGRTAVASEVPRVPRGTSDEDQGRSGVTGQDWLEKDLYSVLGVSKDADAATIKKAYRKLARQEHPDHNPGDAKAEARFKDVGEAYAV